MIYNPLQQRLTWGKIDGRDLWKVLPATKIKDVEIWCDRQQDRLDIRLYGFIKNVLKDGFVDPTIVWYSALKQEFSIHPGMNRVMLNRVIKIPQRFWIISYDENSFYNLAKTFPGLKRLRLDKLGNRDIPLVAQHRKDNRMFEIQFEDDRLLPNFRTEENNKEWTELTNQKGFHVWWNNKLQMTVGNATEKDHWVVDDVGGIYELALKYYFNWEKPNAFIHRKTT